MSGVVLKHIGAFQTEAEHRCCVWCDIKYNIPTLLQKCQWISKIPKNYVSPHNLDGWAPTYQFTVRRWTQLCVCLGTMGAGNHEYSPDLQLCVRLHEWALAGLVSGGNVIIAVVCVCSRGRQGSEYELEYECVSELVWMRARRRGRASSQPTKTAAPVCSGKHAQRGAERGKERGEKERGGTDRVHGSIWVALWVRTAAGTSPSQNQNRSGGLWRGRGQRARAAWGLPRWGAWNM